MKEMELGGIFRDSKLQSYIPGPGRYDSNKSTLDDRPSSLRARLPDISNRHLLKVWLFQLRIRVPEHTDTNRLAKETTMLHLSSETTHIIK